MPFTSDEERNGLPAELESYQENTIEVRESDSDKNEGNLPFLDRLFRRTNRKSQNTMAAQAADIQVLTAAVQALTGQFGAPNWVNVQNAVNTLNASITANNTAIANRGYHVAQIPTFQGGNQDPVAWLRDFNLASEANGWNAVRKLQVVPAYLKGSVATWYQIANNANNFTAWDRANNATDFSFTFL
jgi:hypothetical protein